MATRCGTAVIGLGNPLLADDGLGLEILGRLGREFAFDDGVRLEDGGTWGMELLPILESAERVLFLDAINNGMPPGSLVRVEGPDLPRQFGLKVSPHQVDVQDVLAVATLRGTFPPEAVAIGAQPESL